MSEAAIKVYLAGPEVFLPNALAIGQAKQAICSRYGLEGLFPLDTVLDLAGLVPRAAGLAIYRANVGLMRRCDLVIANITPFRGPSCDIGTGFELGFMAALGRPVWVYTNDDRPYHHRVLDFYGLPLPAEPPAAAALADPAGLAIEQFDMIDNLMLHGAVLDDGQGEVHGTRADAAALFTDLTAFEACVAAAARKFLHRE